VTELSLDIVQALIPQQVNVLYVFCSEMEPSLDGQGPRDLVKSLIVQLLRLQPQVAYNEPLYFRADRFQRAKTFAEVWEIFEYLVLSISDVFLVIDRIEECVSNDDVGLEDSLLPCLAALLQLAVRSRAIVTSIYEAPRGLLHGMPEGYLDSIYIDTGATKRLRRLALLGGEQSF